MKKRILRYRHYSIIVSSSEILSVLVIALLVGMIVESEGKARISPYYLAITLLVVSFTIAFRCLNMKKGANSDLLEPFILNTEISCFDDLIQKTEKRMQIHFSFPDQEPACYGVKKEKFNLYYFFICLSECEAQHREELQRAEAAIKNAVPSRMTRSEWLKHIEFEILVVEHLSEDLKALANRNLAVEPKNKAFIVAHNYYAIVDTSKRKLLIPAFWGDDIASELKYEYCVKQIVSALVD